LSETGLNHDVVVVVVDGIVVAAAPVVLVAAAAPVVLLVASVAADVAVFDVLVTDTVWHQERLMRSDVIKLFCPRFTDLGNKLECLSLANLFKLYKQTL
jgi:hypothetical protein